MDQFLALLAAVLMGCLLGIYSYQILKSRVAPVITTWLLFAVATSLSLASYFSSSTHSIVGNVTNVTDVIFCWALIFVLVSKYKRFSLVFTLFEKVCLGLTALIVLFWIGSHEHVYANILLQVIMTLAFFPTMVKVWQSPKLTESFSVWGINFVATLSAFAASFVRHDLLGMAYAGRALALILILIILMYVKTTSNEKHPAKAG